MNSKDCNNIYKTLVLSGGATKCISSIGALHFLSAECKELDSIENYVGTSAGGILCFFLLIGYTPFELIHFLCKSNFIDEFQNLNLARVIEQKGLINYYIIQEYLEKLTINKIGFLPTFKDLRTKFGKNLTLVTYNLTKNKPEYINADTYPDMGCLNGLRMTSNVPLLFERFFYNECEYLDGGIIDNFPIDKGEGKTIGINFSSLVETTTKNYIMYLLKIAMIPQAYNQSQKVYPDGTDIITINAGIQSFDFNLTITKRLDLFSNGYQKSLEFYFLNEKEHDTTVNLPF